MTTKNDIKLGNKTVILSLIASAAFMLTAASCIEGDKNATLKQDAKTAAEQPVKQPTQPPPAPE